jgi:hypothetical protein
MLDNPKIPLKYSPHRFQEQFQSILEREVKRQEVERKSKEEERRSKEEERRSKRKSGGARGRAEEQGRRAEGWRTIAKANDNNNLTSSTFVPQTGFTRKIIWMISTLTVILWGLLVALNAGLAYKGLFVFIFAVALLYSMCTLRLVFTTYPQGISRMGDC